MAGEIKITFKRTGPCSRRLATMHTYRQTKRRAADGNRDFLGDYDEAQCVALEGCLRLAMTAQGYGIPKLMPALYGLWWVTPELLITRSKCMSLAGAIPADDAEGWVAKMADIAQKDNLLVIHHADAQAVTREKRQGSGDVCGEEREQAKRSSTS